jgi:hypothetical protein
MLLVSAAVRAGPLRREMAMNQSAFWAPAPMIATIRRDVRLPSRGQCDRPNSKYELASGADANGTCSGFNIPRWRRPEWLALPRFKNFNGAVVRRGYKGSRPAKFRCPVRDRTLFILSFG